VYRADFERCPTDGHLLELRTDDPLIGVTLGEHYEIDGFVGEGGMGRVYSAHHTRLQRRQFAIKVLIGDLAATMSTRIRFAQEADAASRLDHPNVVPVIDFGKTEMGLMFLAMELVAGRTLAQVIANEAPLPAKRVVALTRQLCLGLAHAHDRGLVHRDFKPDNVVVVASAGDEVPRILDFGLAISHDEASARMTTVGIALGTPSYASPEQTHHEPVDERADLFALGVTMYEMLSGRLPHDGNAAEQIERNANQLPPPIASRATSPTVVPAALEAIVTRLMARNPDQRFASAAEVIDALDAVATLAMIMPAPIIVKPSRWPFAVAIALGIAVTIVATMLHGVPPEVAPTPTIVMPRTLAVVTPHPTTVIVPSSAAPPREAKTQTKSQLTTKHIATKHIAHVRPTIEATHPPIIVAQVAPSADAPVPARSQSDVEPTLPTLSEPAIPIPPPTRPAPPSPIKLTTASLASLTSHGSLSTALLRRAIERVLPDISNCTRNVSVMTQGPAHVDATFVIDDTRRANTISATGAPALANCVSRALAGLRVADAPDVGTVSVAIEINFIGGS
jgi:serine/threonine-protein kinase